MCISCGCGHLEDSPNDERNITVAAMRSAAAASNRNIEDVLRSTIEECQRMLVSGIPDHQSTTQAVKERLRPD